MYGTDVLVGSSISLVPRPFLYGRNEKGLSRPAMQEGSGNQTIPVTDTAQEAKVEKNTAV